MKRLQLLDYGRFFAALCVVAFHYFFNGIQNGKVSSLSHIPAAVDIVKYGYFGVEFFFMISGYVIFFSSRGRTAGQFMVSRLVRLYPAFWVAVIFTSLVALFWGGSMMGVQAKQVIANLTMLPTHFGQPFVDGVYWTLQLELAFYAWVFLMLFVGLQSRLEAFFTIWPLLIAVAWLTGRSHLPLMDGHYSFFAAGALFAMLGSNRKPWVLFSLAVAYLMCWTVTAGSAFELGADRGVPYSALVLTVITTAMFAFFALLLMARVASIELPGSRMAGALTYPLYLVHAHFGYMVLSKFGTDANRWLVYPLTFAMALGVAWLIHTCVERRFDKFWFRLFNTLGTPVDALSKRLTAGIKLARG